eukprot:TRINITY_DN18225_c0_g1_i1.p1 TRINITY_DN18225_c0_g1~~TRINITY_DN18225_c0_g1_i1.p1  ORF type:complete len:311 (+),score=71.84 TRINITY_DN18225_c0_g1_i1:118-1050(+)
MVVVARIDWIRQQVDRGHGASFACSYNDLTATHKVTVRLWQGRAVSGCENGFVAALFEALDHFAGDPEYLGSDKGHRHSSGVSVVQFYFRRRSYAARQQEQQRQAEQRMAKKGPTEQTTLAKQNVLTAQEESNWDKVPIELTKQNVRAEQAAPYSPRDELIAALKRELAELVKEQQRRQLQLQRQKQPLKSALKKTTEQNILTEQTEQTECHSPRDELIAALKGELAERMELAKRLDGPLPGHAPCSMDSAGGAHPQPIELDMQTEKKALNAQKGLVDNAAKTTFDKGEVPPSEDEVSSRKDEGYEDYVG